MKVTFHLIWFFCAIWKEISAFVSVPFIIHIILYNKSRLAFFFGWALKNSRDRFYLKRMLIASCLPNFGFYFSFLNLYLIPHLVLIHSKLSFPSFLSILGNIFLHWNKFSTKEIHWKLISLDLSRMISWH